MQKDIKGDKWVNTYYINCSECGTDCIIRSEAENPEICPFCGRSIDEIEDNVEFNLLDELDEEEG